MLVRLWTKDNKKVWTNTRNIRLGETRTNDIGYPTRVVWQTSEGEIHNADVKGITGESGDFAHVKERLENEGTGRECWLKVLQRSVMDCLRP